MVAVKRRITTPKSLVSSKTVGAFGSLTRSRRECVADRETFWRRQFPGRSRSLGSSRPGSALEKRRCLRGEPEQLLSPGMLLPVPVVPLFACQRVASIEQVARVARRETWRPPREMQLPSLRQCSPHSDGELLERGSRGRSHQLSRSCRRHMGPCFCAEHPPSTSRRRHQTRCRGQAVDSGKRCLRRGPRWPGRSRGRE